MSGAALPAARALEVVPMDHEGEQVFVVSDPAGFVTERIVVRAPALLILSLLDGRRTVRDIQAELTEQTQSLVPTDVLEKLVADLDAARMLDSPGFRAFRDGEIAAFRAAPVREASLAGLSYPALPAELAPWMDGFFVEPDGPGPRTAAPAAVVRGILAPHLDFPRGRLGYAHAYRALAGGGPPSLVVILGVAHASPASPIVATPKDFATPFGPVSTDREALAVLQRHAGDDLRADEWVHRHEHSAEFQAVWLRHCFPAAVAPGLRILPLLVSSFHGFLMDGRDPMRDPRIAGVVAGLREVLAAAGPGARVIGGVDLSHVGPRYGDAAPVTPEERQTVEAHDRAALVHALRGDPAAWFRTLAESQDRTRVCGLSAVYTFGRVLERVPGTLLRYGQADDEDTGSIVGYCAATFGDVPART